MKRALLGGTGGMPVHLNLMQLNPMHASTAKPERMDEILYHTQKFDMVILVGTSHKAAAYESSGIT